MPDIPVSRNRRSQGLLARGKQVPDDTGSVTSRMAEKNPMDGEKMSTISEPTAAEKFKAKYENAPEAYKEVDGDERDADVASIAVLAEMLDDRLAGIERELKAMNERLRRLGTRRIYR